MVRKQPGSATELKTVDPEPKGIQPPAEASPSAASPSASRKSQDSDAGAQAAAASADAASGSAAPAQKSAALPAAAGSETEPAAAADEERPPPPPRPKPERRVSGFSSNLAELRAAFPEADEGVLRAVLVAASNSLEAAFTGMLAMTDTTIRPAAYINEQIERDARLARRLAESQARREPSAHRSSQASARRSAAPPVRADDADAGDDLYDGFQRGFSDTKQVVSSFWGSLKQKISNEVYDDDVGGEYADDDREPARDQWWPRQAGREQPPLPPRRAGPRAAAREPGSEPKEPRSVNAFGDETAAQRKQWEPVQAAEPEPDAFFIGESDDDDLGSLNEETAPKPDAKAKEAAAKGGETLERAEPKPEPKSEPKMPAKEEPKPEAKEEPKAADGEPAETAETRERRSSTAKDLLNKLKLEAAEKAKSEEKS